MIATLIPKLWPSQAVGIADITAAKRAGYRRILVTSPTGGGKTRIMAELAGKLGLRTIVYSHRKLVRSQTSGVFESHGIRHGVMAAGHDPAFLRDVQVASTPTIASRVFGSGKWDLHDAELVFMDEAHQQKATVAKRIMAEHLAAGATVVGFTATPVGLADLYDILIVAGTNSELRECGALVLAETYGPDEPDLKHIRKVDGAEFTEPSLLPYFDPLQIFGSVEDNLLRLNPDLKPTILFANSVPASRYFVKLFNKRGIRAAHIDANTPDDEREEIRAQSKNGQVQIICNRFVLREGIDWPWVAHGILATAYGALSNYLQSGGRFLRSHGDLVRVTIQDHGGNWHRHGSLNADRVWRLDDTDTKLAQAQKKQRESGKEKEPICCPKCGKIRLSGAVCLFCGHKHVRSSRIVIQVDGTLKRLTGNVTKRKRPVTDDQKAWSACYFKCKNSRRPMTWNQAAAMFRRDRGYDPPPTLNYLPKNTLEWDKVIA